MEVVDIMGVIVYLSATGSTVFESIIERLVHAKTVDCRVRKKES